MADILDLLVEPGMILIVHYYHVVFNFNKLLFNFFFIIFFFFFSSFFSWTIYIVLSMLSLKLYFIFIFSFYCSLFYINTLFLAMCLPTLKKERRKEILTIIFVFSQIHQVLTQLICSSLLMLLKN